MAKRVNIHDAKTYLSRYVREVQQGTETEVVIAAGGSRPLGLEEGLFELPLDIDAQDAEIAELFEGALR